MMISYPAVIRRAENGKYRSDFPDLPGSYAEGDTVDEAVSEAIELLRDFVTATLLEWEDLPKITDVESIELKEGEEVRMISANIRLYTGYDE